MQKDKVGFRNSRSTCTRYSLAQGRWRLYILSDSFQNLNEVNNCITGNKTNPDKCSVNRTYASSTCYPRLGWSKTLQYWNWAHFYTYKLFRKHSNQSFVATFGQGYNYCIVIRVTYWHLFYTITFLVSLEGKTAY